MPHFEKQEQTLRIVAEGLEQISRLADGALGLLQHVEQESKLTQQARVIDTRRCCVLERRVADERREVHQLKQGVGIGVGDVYL